MRPSVSHATNDTRLPDTADDSGATIPAVVRSFRDALTELATAVRAGRATPRPSAMPITTTTNTVAGTDTIDGTWRWMNRLPAATPWAITRPTTTRKTPASGDSTLTSTASSHMMDAI